MWGDALAEQSCTTVAPRNASLSGTCTAGSSVSTALVVVLVVVVVILRVRVHLRDTTSA